MKSADLVTDSHLSAKALEEAMKRALEEPHDGFADLIVHPSVITNALKVANAHNGTDPRPAIRLRVLTSSVVATHDDWKLITRGIEIKVSWEKEKD